MNPSTTLRGLLALRGGLSPSSPLYRRKLDVRRCKSRGEGGTARDKVVGKLARPRQLLRERDAGMDAVQTREDLWRKIFVGVASFDLRCIRCGECSWRCVIIKVWNAEWNRLRAFDLEFRRLFLIPLDRILIK